MFEKTLSDIVKGIRASKRDTALYISQCIAEIKQELNSTDLYVKANALNKLTFLQMMGYSMSWASFASIEVMSSPRFAHKRIGYLAACQGFHQHTDVILLTTNLLQKELRGSTTNNSHSGSASTMGMYEAGLAINCISNIVTEELARNVLPEVTALTKHPQPYLRKKAILCLFKLFIKYPQGLRLAFDSISALLHDADSSVVSCAVNVVTELSKTNPKNFLPLAPSLFSLLVGSQNNWMLIKVVKLLGSLVPEEPRLARKLLEPLSKVCQSTSAKSLLYEAVYTMTLCLPYCTKADGSVPSNVPAVLELCATTLQDFISDSDPNLKYLGLVGFASLRHHMSTTKWSLPMAARPLILACLSDDDVTIRTRALDLLPGMVNRKNIQELIHQLLNHVVAATGQYKHDLVSSILELCGSDKYALLNDFAWYFDILVQLSNASISPMDMGPLVAKQILDLALRVLPVRPHAVQEGTRILLSQSSSAQSLTTNTQLLPQVLPAMAWIVGEYSDLLSASTNDSEYAALIQALTLPHHINALESTTLAVYLEAALKITSASAAANASAAAECITILVRHLPVYMQSLDVEVQERACTGMELLRVLSLVDGTPNAMSLDDDDDSDNNDDNLLDMGNKASIAPPKSKKASTLTTRCRNAAPTLQYIFKPEPMKPISSKAQRKKRASPLGGIDLAWLEAPVDMNILGLAEDSNATKHRPTMEQVSFTQQRPFQSTSVASTSSGPDLSIFGSNKLPQHSLPKHGAENSAAFGGETSALSETKTARPRPQDPFYLNDNTKTDGMENDTEGNNRFGTIQLLDSDDDDDVGRRNKRKTKKKKKQVAVTAPLSTAITAVYHSDDDEDDDDILVAPRHKSIHKDFAGLALVDLTTPLGDDEMILPAREHRQVPDRTSAATEKAEPKRIKKKKKKPKEQSSSFATTSGVGDLLDLGGFSPVADVSNPAIMMTTQATSGVAITANKISSAFDDLLGLEATPMSSTMTETATSTFSPIADITPAPSFKSGKKLWMKASLKVSSSNGSSMIDWNKVSVYYKVTSYENGKATLSVRVQNDMMTAPLNDLILSLKNQESGPFSLVAVMADDSKETKNIGPISYKRSGMDFSSLDLKGLLVSSSSMDQTSKVHIKITLPVTLFLSPTPGLSLERVMEEVSCSVPSFASVNTRVELSKLVNSPDSVAQILASFFHATQVEGSNGLMLAAQSSTADPVRILMKMKGSTIRLDIKSTNALLCKVLAENVKRLVL